MGDGTSRDKQIVFSHKRGAVTHRWHSLRCALEFSIALLVAPATAFGQTASEVIRPNYGDLPTLAAQLSDASVVPGLGLTTVMPRTGTVDRSATERDKPVGLVRAGTVTINPSSIDAFLAERELSLSAGSGQIAGQPRAFQLALFDDLDVRIVKANDYIDSLGNRITHGIIVSGEGGWAAFVIDDYNITANIRVGERNFQINPAGNGLHSVVEFDENAIPRSRDDTVTPEPPPEPAGTESPSSAPKKESSADKAAATTAINILGVYTPDVLRRFPNIAAQIALSVDDLNTTLANSQIDVRVSLVGAQQVQYVEETARGSDKILDDAIDRVGDFARIAGEASRLGADLFAVWGVCTDVGGIATLNPIITSTSDSTRKFYANRSAALTCAGFSFISLSTFTHEVGHNLNAQHDRYVVPSGQPGPTAYNFGYIDTTAKFTDVMAYSNQCDDLGISCPRIKYFSNPNVNYNGRPVGVAFDKTNSADNARTIGETAPLIATFRTLLYTPTQIDTTFLAATVNGSGSVTNSRDSQACAATCRTKVFPGTVTLTASASRGWRFTGWGGACASSGTSATCSVSALLETAVTANFERGSITTTAYRVGASILAEPNLYALTEIAVTPEGTVWFFNTRNNFIGRLLNGAITFFTAPTTSGITADSKMDVGADGAVWFTQPTANKIARIAADGTITEYNVPTASSSPRGITLGPDGAIWFTEYNVSKIGRITTNGTITEFNLPSGKFPAQLTTGPDGALWMTLWPSGIGRMTTSGTFSDFTIPTASSFPRAITAGPDGALWFVETSTNKIGRITTAGVITEYAVPTASYFPRSIIAGPDGALWYAGNGFSKIGRITTSGTITEYSTSPDLFNNYSLVRASDGAMWVLDYYRGPGRVNPSDYDVRLASLYPAARTDNQSFMRFFNSDSQAGTVSVTLTDATTGNVFARWNSPSIPAGSGPQYSISFAEAAASSGSAVPTNYTAAIQSNFAGTFQHVLYSAATATLTNLSTCTPASAARARRLINVHTTHLDFGYPSSVVVNNTGTVAASVDLGIYDAITGAKRGTYRTAAIPSNGKLVLNMAQVQSGAAITVEAGVFHLTLQIETPFTGFLQHFVNNVRAGVITDMTTTCALNTASGPGVETALSESALTDTALPVGPLFNISAITAGPDGAVWYTKGGTSNKIGRVPSSGAATEYNIPTFVAVPYGIINGPDGALWFTENDKNKIGRITTAGAFTEYVIPTASSGPRYIALGVDNALWFTESSANKIGRITTTGTFTEYSVPTASSQPWGIAADGSGNLWFTENSGNKIGRITTSGAITEFAIPTASSRPEFIVQGSDGAMWFTEYNVRKIGRISASGVVTEYDISLFPTSLVAGPDGALWFTAIKATNSYKVGRLTTDGALTVFDTGGANFTTMGVAADRTLWLAYSNGEKVARVVPTLRGLQASAIFSSAQTDSQSFMRFSNTGSAAGTVTVTLADTATGGTLGQWTSPSIPAGASQQFAITSVEATAATASAKPNFYSATAQATFPGGFQHVLWRSTDGTLTNLSTCNTGSSASPTRLINVHSSLLDFGYPSSVVVNNTGSAPAIVTLGVYNSNTGARLGSNYVTSSIRPGGQAAISISSIEQTAGITPSSGNIYHYIIKAESPFQGFLQHLVLNRNSAVITDMSTTCALN